MIQKKEKILLRLIESLSRKLPSFSDGRIDYTDSDKAYVVDVFLKYRDRILLLKRSDEVSTYKGKWNCVSGYLDEIKPLTEKALEEVEEELGLDQQFIDSIKIGKNYQFRDVTINRTYIISPILMELKRKPAIRLDFENTDYRWIRPQDLKEFDIVPHLDMVLKNVLLK